MSLKTVFIKSGECYYGGGEMVHTTLGSCVAVCVFDRRRGIGGMIHFRLPVRPPGQVNGDNLDFGDLAVLQLLRRFKQDGSHPRDLDVSILGGLLTDPASHGANSKADDIARENVIVADKILADLGLRAAKRLVNRRAKSLQIRMNSSTGNIDVQLDRKRTSDVARAPNSPVRVLVVDDSKTVRALLKQILGKNPKIEVVGEAADAFEAEALRSKLSPDVMTLDLHMPKKDGVTYLRELMASHPMPVILVSDLSSKNAGPVMQALELGAFDYLHKHPPDEFEEMTEKLHKLVLAAAVTPVKKIMLPAVNITRQRLPRTQHDPSCLLMAIGASTGGTEALREVFADMSASCPPVVIVQHMPAAFTKAFAESLNHCSEIEIKEAETGDVLQTGHAYLAPGGKQMRVSENRPGEFVIEILDAPPMNRFKPSVDFLFLSLAELKSAPRMKAALLTGMGEDGARGLLRLRRRGAWTIAQDEATSVVFGMPKAAIEINAADVVVPLADVSGALQSPRPQTSRLKAV